MANNTKDMLIRTYNSIVKEYASHEYENPLMEKHYGKFLSLIPKGAKVLDAGCGPGQATKRFAEKGCKVAGIDLSEKMIAFAKENAPQADFFVMDIENMTLRQKFDAIWAAFVLIHIPRERHLEILQRFFELLRPGGILYLGMLEGKGEKTTPEPYNRKYKQYFVFTTRAEIEGKLKASGFGLLGYSKAVQKEEGVAFTLSSIYARKP